MTQLLDTLGVKVLPKVFSSLKGSGITETMEIMRREVTAGPGGGRVKGTDTKDYWDVPVSVEPYDRLGTRYVQGEKPISIQRYLLTFPTHTLDGKRIDVDVKAHRLKVIARGNEPEKWYRVETVRDQSGVVFEAICQKEN